MLTPTLTTLELDAEGSPQSHTFAREYHAQAIQSAGPATSINVSPNEDGEGGFSWPKGVPLPIDLKTEYPLDSFTLWFASNGDDAIVTIVEW